MVRPALALPLPYTVKNLDAILTTIRWLFFLQLLSFYVRSKFDPIIDDSFVTYEERVVN